VTVLDEELRAYVDGIEDYLRRLRGAEHTLSPRDFALARSWHSAGVPLAVVLVAVDEAFEGRGEVASLTACRHRVERLAPAEPGRGAHSRESSGLPDISSLLDALIEGLERLASPRAGVMGLALERARELGAFVSVASRPNWDYVERKLREVDAEVDSTVLGALEPAVLEELRRGSARAVERHRGRVATGALEAAIDRSLVQRARERLGLPRSLV